MKIGIDVDQTLLNMLPAWAEFILNQYGYDIEENPVDKYQFGEEVTDRILERESGLIYYADVLDFWKNQHLYDFYEVDSDMAVLMKEWLYDGHTLIFVSHCFPEHENSKWDMIRRALGQHNPEQVAFISTKYKQFVECDIMIDDSPSVYSRFVKNWKSFDIALYTKYWFHEDNQGFFSDSLKNELTKLSECVFHKASTTDQLRKIINYTRSRQK